MIEETNHDITVQGFSPRYLAAFAALIGVEGELSEDPADRGGTTKYGVSLRFLKSAGAFDEDGNGIAEFDLDMDGDIDGADIRLLTPGDAKMLFFRFFWQAIDADRLPRPLGEALFDQAVNGGVVAAKKLLQRALNQCMMEAQRRGATPPALLKVDGQLGAASHAALQWVLRYPGAGMPILIMTFRDVVRERYRQIVRRYPGQQRFLRGWLARAEGLGR